MFGGAVYSFVANAAVRTGWCPLILEISTFAYEDYGLPYCFMASLFNTGINEPNDYSEETIARISKDGEITRNESDEPEEDLPNILFVQLESYFDVEEAEFFTTSKDACPQSSRNVR